MVERLTPDICVIGAGSGGLSCAAAAAAFGVSVVLLEKGKMGGDCLNYGCVPSKAIIAAAKVAETQRQSGRFGIEPREPQVDFKKVHDHIRNVIAAIAPNDSVERFTGLGVHVITQAGRFVDEKTVIAGEYEIQARRFVVATGSSALIPPVQGLADIKYFTNENIFELTTKPDHLLVVGGGPIGMELAQAHRRLGAKVSVIETATFLPQAAPEQSAIVVDAMRREGITLHDHTTLIRVQCSSNGGVDAVVKTQGVERIITSSHLLLATGRVPNIAQLEPDRANIAHEKTGLLVDATMRTSNRRVYAIGDVVGGLQFTHVAGYHAGLVIRSIIFRAHARENRDIIPWVTFTDPEVAHVGLTETQARERYGKIHVLRWTYDENDRAQAERKTCGNIKVIANKKGKILGAGIVGHNAGEIINTWSLAIAQGLKISAMTSYVAPYPTMNEIGKRAALEFYKPILRKRWVRPLVKTLQLFG